MGPSVKGTKFHDFTSLIFVGWFDLWNRGIPKCFRNPAKPPTRWRIFCCPPSYPWTFLGVDFCYKSSDWNFVHVHSKLYSAFRIFVYVVFATLKLRFGDFVNAALTNDLECCTRKPRLDSLHAMPRRVNNSTPLKKTQNDEWTKYPGGAKKFASNSFYVASSKKLWFETCIPYHHDLVTGDLP